jgi:aspartate aminotransferase
VRTILNDATSRRSNYAKNKMLWYCLPLQPSGSVYSREEFYAEVLKKYPNIVIVADEIYEHINFSELFAALLYSRNV